MSTKRPATCVAEAVLLALLLWPAGGRADDGVPSATAGPQPPEEQAAWCEWKECVCSHASSFADNEQQSAVSVKCTFTGDKNVELKPFGGSNKDLYKTLVSVELYGDGRGNLTVHGKTFAQFDRLRSFGVGRFAGVTVKRQGLHAPNAPTDGPDSAFAVSVVGARRVLLETNAVQPLAGRADVLVEDCDAVRLEAEVAARLRTFAFRRIGSLQLSENTFKNAAAGFIIENMTLEDLTADKLPSKAFITSIEQLSITDCTFGTIERNAFPVNTMTNATLTNVTVDLLKTEAFQQSLIITNLVVRGCRFNEMENNSIVSVVQSIHIERSQFGTVRSAAVVVANELTLRNNTFGRVESRGFVLRNYRSVHVDGNRFDQVDEYAFAEESAAATARQTWSEVRVRDNAFRQQWVAGGGGGDRWSPAFLLLTAANQTVVTGNRFLGWCDCEPWRLVDVVDSDDLDDDAAATYTTADAVDGVAPTEDEDDGGGDFADTNYCRPNETAAICGNLTAEAMDRDYALADFHRSIGCARHAEDFARCVRERSAIGARDGRDGRFRFSGKAIVDKAREHGVLTVIMLFILCGFGAACAVRAVSWLNARGVFIKLRSALTSNGGRGDGGGGGGGGRRDRGGDSAGGASMDRTLSAHSLSPMSVHEYAELRRQGDKPAGAGAAELGMRVIVFQDRGTQTVPEELTHEMLQTLRDKLDDPDDYAEARGMIEHLYDMIRVEESCCGAGTWPLTASGGLDDMTSTITTKAVQADGSGGPEVRTVGTAAPSLERLWPPRPKPAQQQQQPKQPQQQQQQQRPAATEDRLGHGHRRRGGPTPPLPRPPDHWTAKPSVRDEYATPADYLRGTAPTADPDPDDDDDADAALYCELADLRPAPAIRQNGPRPTPPPVPVKPAPRV